MEIKVGDIYWLKSKGLISHPHVVIKINSEENKFTLCSITSNSNKLNLPGNVTLDLNEGNLSKLSIVEVSKTFEVNNTQLIEYIGCLNQNRVNEILQGIKYIDKYLLNTNIKP